MLPTPAARDWKGQGLPSREGGLSLPTVLLPTPKTPTGGSEKRVGRQKRGSGGEDLEARLASLGELTNPPSEEEEI